MHDRGVGASCHIRFWISSYPAEHVTPPCSPSTITVRRQRCCHGSGPRNKQTKVRELKIQSCENVCLVNARGMAAKIAMKSVAHAPCVPAPREEGRMATSEKKYDQPLEGLLQDYCRKNSWCVQYCTTGSTVLQPSLRLQCLTGTQPR